MSTGNPHNYHYHYHGQIIKLDLVYYKAYVEPSFARPMTVACKGGLAKCWEKLKWRVGGVSQMLTSLTKGRGEVCKYWQSLTKGGGGVQSPPRYLTQFVHNLLLSLPYNFSLITYCVLADLVIIIFTPLIPSQQLGSSLFGVTAPLWFQYIYICAVSVWYINVLYKYGVL